MQKSSETQRWSEVFVSLSTYLLMLKFLSSACQGCIKSCAFIWKTGKESADGNDSDKRKRMNKTSEELGILVDTGIKSVLVLLCFALLELAWFLFRPYSEAACAVWCS